MLIQKPRRNNNRLWNFTVTRPRRLTRNLSKPNLRTRIRRQFNINFYLLIQTSRVIEPEALDPKPDFLRVEGAVRSPNFEVSIDGEICRRQIVVVLLDIFSCHPNGVRCKLAFDCEVCGFRTTKVVDDGPRCCRPAVIDLYEMRFLR